MKNCPTQTCTQYIWRGNWQKRSFFQVVPRAIQSHVYSEEGWNKNLQAMCTYMPLSDRPQQLLENGGWF